MFTNIDTLIHLPSANAGPWQHVRECYERRVVFKCKHGNYRHSILSVYAKDEGGALVFVRIDGVVCELSVREYADPFSTADETLLALSHECYCHTEMNGESL